MRDCAASRSRPGGQGSGGASAQASDWYKPSSWFVQGTEVHSTRLMTFIGREVPDLLKPAYSFGGCPCLRWSSPMSTTGCASETDDIRINGGVLDPAETRKSIANNPDSRYPGIDPDAVPNLLEEEEEGLESNGAAAGISERVEDDRDQNENVEPARKAA